MPLANLRWLVVPAVATLFLGQLGCASRPIRVPPPSDQPTSELGTVGVASARFVPKANYWTPPGIGRGAAKGLVKGAEIGAKVGFWPGAVAGGLVGAAGREAGILLGAIVVGSASAGASAIVAAPVGATVGAVAAAVKAPPRAAVKKAEAELETILADLKVQEAMRDHVAQLVREQARHLALITDRGPTAQDPQASYRSLAGEAIDTVLELAVSAIQLSGRWGVDSRGTLLMTVRARVIRVSDGTGLYARDFEYGGGTGPFVDLADDGQPLREALQLAYQSLAKEIVGELFARFTLRREESPPVHEEEQP